MSKVAVNNYGNVSERYGGFWVRVAASIIDGIIISVPLSVLFIIYSFIMAPNEGTATDGEMVTMLLGYTVIYIIALVAIALYYILTTASKMQGTVGKKIMGLIVTDLNGNRLTFGRATGRYFATILSGMIFYIGYLMAAFTEKNKHCMI
ncbi:RDD family protein [Peribacillus psychrosaccharolyticus]|uniref:RDD family protein n=1 Tax=Peribacillus psychrosaccharolyticus TaxID=1407 RepID=UPI0002F607D5|nr:RDD family protein [Peribacillus psychrosaccharolyticus]